MPIKLIKRSNFGDQINRKFAFSKLILVWQAGIPNPERDRVNPWRRLPAQAIAHYHDGDGDDEDHGHDVDEDEDCGDSITIIIQGLLWWQ